MHSNAVTSAFLVGHRYRVEIKSIDRRELEQRIEKARVQAAEVAGDGKQSREKVEKNKTTMKEDHRENGKDSEGAMDVPIIEERSEDEIDEMEIGEQIYQDENDDEEEKEAEDDEEEEEEENGQEVDWEEEILVAGSRFQPIDLNEVSCFLSILHILPSLKYNLYRKFSISFLFSCSCSFHQEPGSPSGSGTAGASVHITVDNQGKIVLAHCNNNDTTCAHSFLWCAHIVCALVWTLEKVRKCAHFVFVCSAFLVYVYVSLC